ncbi:transposase [Bacillota bacterium Meth-B3]
MVGWAVSRAIDRNLAIAALENAVKNRRPGRGFIFHTDRGSQYASADFRSTLAKYGGLQSMSGPGSPYDNACAESFFRSLKVECVDATHFATRTQAPLRNRRVHAVLQPQTPAGRNPNLRTCFSSPAGRLTTPSLRATPPGRGMAAFLFPSLEGCPQAGWWPPRGVTQASVPAFPSPADRLTTPSLRATPPWRGARRRGGGPRGA